MWRILQQPKPDDYVLATGEAYSVRQFVERAFAHIGRQDQSGKAKARAEHGVDAASGQILVEIDARYYRPTEVEYLLGDPSKARRVLGWNHQITFDQLVGRDGRARTSRPCATSKFIAEIAMTELVSEHRDDACSICAASASMSPVIKAWLGAAIVRRLASEGCELLTADRKTLDLTQQEPTEEWICASRAGCDFSCRRRGLAASMPTMLIRPISSPTISPSGLT